MKFEIIRTLTEFQKLKDEWQDLFDGSDQHHNVFASYNWHKAVMHIYKPVYERGSFELAIVVGRRRGKVELICPTVVRKRFGVTLVSWIGDPVSQYGDIVIKTGKSFQPIINSALQYLVRETGADAMVFERVREDSAVAQTLMENDHCVVRRQKAPLIDLEGIESGEQYIASLSSSRRKKQRRLWRRLGELGPAKFEITAPGPKALKSTRATLALKAKMLADQGTFSRAFSDPYFRPFFEYVATDPSAGVGFQIGLLTVGDDMVAAEIGFRSGDAYIAHIGVYDADLRKYAPGHLHMERTLSDAVEKGVRQFDFLAPVDDYKLSWSNDSVDVVDYALPVTRAGKVYCSVLKMTGPAAGMLKRALPASMMRYATHK